MNKLNQMLVLSIFIPFQVYSQNQLDKVETTTFANYGDYNKRNHHIIYGAIELDLDSALYANASIQIKNMKTGQETTIVANLFLSSPVFGWIDSSYVFYETTESTGDPKILGPWQGCLIKYNIFTHQKDTISNFRYSSKNYVRNLFASHGRLFYTIVYKGKNTLDWMMYLFKSGEIIPIKENVRSNNIEIITYDFILNINTIVYVRRNHDEIEFVNFSLSTGKEEIIRTIDSDGIAIVSSTIKNNIFYYVEKKTKKNSKLESPNYTIKALNINTGNIKPVYLFSEGVEVSNIDIYEGGKLLISAQRSIKENETIKQITLPKSGSITIGLNSTSYLYTIPID